jgi:hypothetical protein
MKKILVGIPVKNTGRFLENLFNQLINLNYNHKLITVVLIEGDSHDNSFEICKSLQNKYKHIFNDINVFKLNFNFHLNHDFSRYEKHLFPDRIKNLIITRNFIVDNFLDDNDYIWWVDSDFEIIEPNTINQFINHDKDVIIPKVTHDKWQYHDCGSVVIENGIQHRFQFINKNLVKLDRADTHCFIKRHVFDANIRYTYVQKEYADGCGGNQHCYSDGTQFSFDCINRGFEVYGVNDIIIKHHNV